MQAADIFELVPGGIDICQPGVDQRKVNMLAIEYAHKKGLKTPIALSHHMVMGLTGKGKMSKSEPDSAILMDDSRAEIKRKMLKAFCPDWCVAPTGQTKSGPDVSESNPNLQHLILRWDSKVIICGKEYSKMAAICEDYGSMKKKKLKLDLTESIWQIVRSVHEKLNSSELKDLTERVASYRVTK